MPDLRRRGCLHDVGASHILEHRDQIEFLLIVSAQRIACLLTDDREHGLVIQQGIVKPGDQMRGAGARSRDTDPDLARELRIGARHESGHLLMPRLDKADLALSALKGAEYAVDAIAGIAKEVADAPLMQTLNDEIGDGLGPRGRPSFSGIWFPVFEAERTVRFRRCSSSLTEHAGTIAHLFGLSPHR